MPAWAVSSARSERLAYTEEVGGSSPPPPTTSPPPGAPPPASEAPSGRPPGWGPPSTRPRIWPLLLLGALLLAAVVAAIAVFAPGIAGEMGGLARPGAVLVQDLEVGDCYQGTVAKEGETIVAISVQKVDCAEAHTAEVIAAFDFEGGLAEQATYPGDEIVAAEAEQGCLERFAEYVGVPYEESQLDIQYYYPLERNWLAGDRAVSCSVLDPQGANLEGSVRGTGR
jgi:hypothetical protein